MQDLFFSDNKKFNHHWTFVPSIYLSQDSLESSNILNSKELLIFILESIQDGVSILDLDMNIRYVNNSIKNWYRSSRDILGKKCYQIYHKRKLPCEKCPVKRTTETKKAEVETVPYDSPAGDNGWQELFSIPIFNNQKKLIAVLEYVRDISLQRYVESRLSRLQERIEDIERRNDILTQILKRREEEKEELESTITNNMEKFVRPSLEYLKRFTDKEHVEFVECLIKEIVQPITRKRSQITNILTPRELQIAEMIRDGKTSKEMADILCVSKKTIDFHRANIRKKLNIAGKDTNLRAYLLSNY